MVKSLVQNPYLYLGSYIRSLVSSVMYCILEPLAASINPLNDHWTLRDYAALLLSHIFWWASQMITAYARVTKRLILPWTGPLFTSCPTCPSMSNIMRWSRVSSFSGCQNMVTLTSLHYYLWVFWMYTQECSNCDFSMPVTKGSIDWYQWEGLLIVSLPISTINVNEIWVEGEFESVIDN